MLMDVLVVRSVLRLVVVVCIFVVWCILFY